MRLIIILCGLFAFNSYSNKYLEVQGVAAEEDGSFSTSREHSFKVYEGMPALLSTENVTVKAKVLSFKRNTIVWEMAAQEIPVPFYQGDQVLFQNYEHLLTRQQRVYSNNNLKKLIKERQSLKETVQEKKLSGYNVDVSYGSEVSSTYSLITSEQLESINDFGISFAYFLPIANGIYFAPGFGFSSGIIKTTGDSFTTSLTEITAEFIFQLNGNPDSENIPYVGIGLGVGISSTSFANQETAGHTISLPRLTGGILFPVKGSQAGMTTEIILDGVSIREEKDGVQNKANKANLKFAIGYQKFFQ